MGSGLKYVSADGLWCEAEVVYIFLRMHAAGTAEGTFFVQPLQQTSSPFFCAACLQVTHVQHEGPLRRAVTSRSEV